MTARYALPLLLIITWSAQLRGQVTSNKPTPIQDGPPSTTGVVEVPEKRFETELIGFPDPWSFLINSSGMVLVSDQQLIDLASDPDKPVNLSLTAEPDERTLRQICQRAQQQGHHTLAIAFDYFWAQYRTEVRHVPRRLWPDTSRYVELIGQISQFASEYGLGIELSLLSPLEIGHGYRNATGEMGRWLHYREGLRDPASGGYSVQLWRQRSWTNNKGTVELVDLGVRVLAFREQGLAGSPYCVVDPAEIVDISDTAQVEVYEGLQTGQQMPRGVKSDPTSLGGYSAVRIRVHGSGRSDIGPLDRVLAVQIYGTPEMDYFSASATPFLRGLVDQYVDAGVHFNALYADETHIQGDWTYARHHDHNEFAVRYVSPGFEQMFARRFGAEYDDFARWLVYFTRGQHDFANDLSASSGAMHVVGRRPIDIARTALLRARYYELLQNHVVDLFAGAKGYLEQRMGHQVHSRAHATWAESPTIDQYASGQSNSFAQMYDYTSNFISSNTVHQAASACHDYFQWGDFLHGTGNDTAECGWLDRNYWGFSLASSLGVLNRVRNAYAAHWGMPREVAQRRSALRDAWGTWPSWPYGIVQEMEHREVDVLMLYPLDLVAVDERFGSWMTQYAYANWITQAKLLERGRVVDGTLEVANRRYTTLVAVFEPFPRPELLALMQQLASQGGRVVWSGPPPVVTRTGEEAVEPWQRLTGAQYQPTLENGLRAPGRQIDFSAALDSVGPMTILTDLLPDRVYPVEPNSDVEVIARLKGQVVGTLRRTEAGGTVAYLGFRPRDDQSMMMGYDERHWLDILHALGSYPPTGRYAGVQDNTEYVARTGELFVARFPNGTLSIAPHLRHVEEAWPGGFHRDAAEDARIVQQLSLPSQRISVQDLKIHGHRVDYEGDRSLAFRVDDAGRLIAFVGHGSQRITIDGRETVFADRPLPLLAWAPVPAERRVEGGAVLMVYATGAGDVSIPVSNLPAVHVCQEGQTPGSRGPAIESRIQDGKLVFQTANGRSCYYVVPAEPTRPSQW